MTKTEQSSTSKEIPKHRNALIEKYEKQPEKTVTTEATKLPKPTGWRMLVLPFKMNEKTKIKNCNSTTIGTIALLFFAGALLPAAAE